MDFLRRRPIVVIPRAIAALGIHRPRHLEGLLAHELSHLANGDANRAAFARVVTEFVAGLIVCSALFVALFFFVSYGQAIYKFGWRYSIEVALVGFVVGTLQYAGYGAFLASGYALLLQVREFYADAGAKSLGYANELEEMLQGPRIPWYRVWRHITAFHPPALHRIESLREPSGIHELRFTTVAMATALGFASAKLVGHAFSSFEIRDQILVIPPLIFLLQCLPSAVIALRYGTKFSASTSHQRGDLTKGMVIGASAVFTGVTASGVFVELIDGVEVEAPYGQIALEKLLGELWNSFLPAGILVGAMLVGNAVSVIPRASKVELGLWFLFALAFSLALGQVSLFASFPLIFGYETKTVLSMLQAVILELNAGQSVDDRTLSEFVGSAIGAQVVAAVFGVGALLLVSTKRARSLMPGSLRALAAMTFLIAGFACGGVAGNAIGAELFMRDSIWISCQSIAGAKRTENNVLNQARNLLIEEFVAVGGQAQSFRGQVFFGRMEEGRCGETPTEDRRPWYRSWLVDFGLAKDGILVLSFETEPSESPQRVVVSYVDGNTRTDLGIISGREDAAVVVVRAFHKFDPYRNALLLRGKGLDASEAMKEASNSSDSQTRAWALTQLARTDLTNGNRYEAERKFLLALELSPGHPMAGGILADLYFDSGQCAQAVDLVESIRRTSEFTALRLQRAAQCQGDRALAYLYKYRKSFQDDAVVLAYIGELAFIRRRYSLAALYFQKSLSVTSERAALAKVAPTRVGCVDLYVAIQKKGDVCVGDVPCAPPINLQSGREHMCWAKHAATYNKAAEARKHFEIAAKLDPKLANWIAMEVTKLPR